MGWQLHHVEVFLCDEMSIHAKTKFIAPRSREDQRGNVDSEIRNLQAVADDDIRQRGAAYQLFTVEVYEVDLEVIGPFRIRQAEVEPHLLMLEGKADCLQMREEPDEALLLGDAVFNDLVADQKGLNAWLNDIGHDSILRRISLLSKGFRIFAEYGAKERSVSGLDGSKSFET
jgi:hypothetical protein